MQTLSSNMPSTSRHSDQSRRDRYAEQDWFSAEVRPDGPTWATVKSSELPGAPSRRVLFSGHVWLTSEAVALWKPSPPSDDIVSRLLETARGPTAIEGLETLELGELPPGDERFVLAQLARMELDVEVVRLYQSDRHTSGTVSGKVLAVSANYAAQAVGQDGVLIVEQQLLNRRLQPGENVTVDFQGGRGKVYSGLLFDVNIRAPFLSRDQVGWLRMLMIEALSQTEDAPNEDQLIKEALRYALAETVRTYALKLGSLPKTQITLAVRDALTPAQLEAQALAQGNSAVMTDMEKLAIEQGVSPSSRRSNSPFTP